MDNQKHTSPGNLLPITKFHHPEIETQNSPGIVEHEIDLQFVDRVAADTRIVFELVAVQEPKAGRIAIAVAAGGLSACPDRIHFGNSHRGLGVHLAGDHPLPPGGLDVLNTRGMPQLRMQIAVCNSLFHCLVVFCFFLLIFNL